MIWYKYWQSMKRIKDANPHKQVGRTNMGNPIDEINWEKTIQSVFKIIKINKNKTVLDLCCGNGLLSKELSPYCKKVVSVDFSKKLLDKFVTNASNIEKINSDVLKINFDNNTFDIVIIYFAIQHFTEEETVELVGKCKKWLKQNGLLFIGDIPELEKKWTFFSNKKYRINYIDSILNNEPIIGTWFSREFFTAVGEYHNFSRMKILNQKAFMINHELRFDVLYEK